MPVIQLSSSFYLGAAGAQPTTPRLNAKGGMGKAALATKAAKELIKQRPQRPQSPSRQAMQQGPSRGCDDAAGVGHRAGVVAALDGATVSDGTTVSDGAALDAIARALGGLGPPHGAGQVAPRRVQETVVPRHLS